MEVPGWSYAIDIVLNDEIDMSMNVVGIWDAMSGSGSVRAFKKVWTCKQVHISIGNHPWPDHSLRV